MDRRAIAPPGAGVEGMSVDAVLDKALEGRELSAEDGAALFAAEGENLDRLLSCRRRTATPQSGRSRRLRDQSQRQFHERLREALRLLRVQPRPSRGARLFPAHRGDSAAGSRGVGSWRYRGLYSGRAAAAHRRIVLHRSVRGHQERTSRDSRARVFARGDPVRRNACPTGASKII